MKGIWIIAANSCVARIFRAENNHQLIEHFTLVHPQSRLKNHDVTTERPGKGHERIGPGRHAVTDYTPIKEHEATVFAKEIADELHKGVSNGEITKLYIAAGPTFLGLIRKHLHAPVEKIVAGEINKDISTLSLEQIREHLPLVL